MTDEVQEDVQERDYEAEARKDGWTPIDEWRGPEDKWKTAEQFVKDGENINGILRSKIERLDARVGELLESNKQINEFAKRAREKDKAEKAKLIKELEEARQQAIDDGDGATFTRTDAQINELRSEPDPAEQQLDPLAEKWLGENQWYAQNFELGAYADGLADRLRGMGYTGQAYYDELTKRVKERFPEEFGNKSRKKPASVESGGTKASGSKAKSFDALPAEAKAAYERFKRDIPGFTKKDYVEQYDWDQGEVNA